MALDVKGLPLIQNGDQVIGFTSSKKLKELGWQDLSTVYGWYEDDPNKNHLGMVETWENMNNYEMPSYKEFFKKQAIIEVNGVGGKFTYDLPVRTTVGVYTMTDTSSEVSYPGLDEGIFPLDLNHRYQPGDVLAANFLYGDQVVVTQERPVERKGGDVYRHWVKLVTYSKSDSYDSDLLRKGIKYSKVGHSLGEFSEQYSNFDANATTGSIKCEFILGNDRGAETFYTMYANKKSINGAAASAKDFWTQYQNKIKNLKEDSLGDLREMFFVANRNPQTKKIDKTSIKIGTTLESLVIMELMKMEATSLLFQKGGLIKDIDGTKRLNEGIWHQYRRGRKIEYARPGGATRNHIRKAAAYIFRNNKGLPTRERKLVFEVGTMMQYNLLQIFKDEVHQQLGNLGGLLGTDRILPQNPVSGKDLTSLKLSPVMFDEVYLPDIGNVSFKLNRSLDYQHGGDRTTTGFYGDGYAWTTYSAIIWDASSDEYSNYSQGISGGAKMKNDSANVYYVKPEGANFYWGYRNGRYASDTSTNIASSIKVRGKEFWAHCQSAGWVKDISKMIVIELKEQNR